MKGKTLRLVSALLALALLLGALGGCGKNNSVLKLPDGTASAATDVRETPGPLTPLGDRTCKVGKETIPESALFSFILIEANFDPLQGLTLKLRSANKASARDFVVSLPYLSVNGYMQDAAYEVRVPAGQSVEGEILIPATDLRASGVSSVDELILYPLIYDETMPMGQGDVVDGAFSFYPTGLSAGNVTYPVRQKTSVEQAFFDNGSASCIILDVKAEDDALTIHSYLENKTDRFLSFSWSDVTVKNAPVVYDGDAVVAPGMRRYVSVSLPSVDGLDVGYNEVALRVSATPLSNTGETLSPLLEQRGSYRFTGANAVDIGTGATGTEGGDEPVQTAAATATPAPTMTIYTTPTTAQKKNAKNGYVNKDQVNMRSGPGTKYKTVGGKVGINSTAILYELQDGWWFLKCNNRYGYIKADYISQGKPKATPKPEEDNKTFEGVVTVQSKAALRKSADPDSKCLKELSNGAKVTVYYKTKGKDGHSWYYLSYGKTKGYIRSDLVKVTGKVPTR